MPLMLPQFSRRDFLKRATLAGAALAFAPRGFADALAKPVDPHTVFFLSDCHISEAVTDEHLGANMTDCLQACVGELAAWPVRPTTVMVNGDLAYQMGRAGDYVQFGKLIEPVRALASVHLSLGNHDSREHFWNTFPADVATEHDLLQRQASIFETERANWFQLDTLEATNHTPGELGQAQLDWLAKELDARPGKPAIIVLHHNPQFANPVEGLQDTAALMAVLVPRKQVKLVIFGHTHDWRVSQHESGIHLVNLPPTGYVFIKGRPNGWVRATLAVDGAELELRAQDKQHPQHAQAYVMKWRDEVA